MKPVDGLPDHGSRGEDRQKLVHCFHSHLHRKDLAVPPMVKYAAPIGREVNSPGGERSLSYPDEDTGGLI